MKFILTDNERIKKFIDMINLLKNINDVVQMRFYNNRLLIQSLDKNRVTLVDCYIHKDWFRVYDAELSSSITKITTYNEGEELDENEIFDCANILSDQFSKILGAYQKGCALQISKDNKTEKLQIFIDSKKGVSKQYEISMIDFEEDLLELPEIDYSLEFSLELSDAISYIKHLEEFGDNVKFVCRNDNIYLISKDEVGDHVRNIIHIPYETLQKFIIDEDLNLNATYILKCLKNILMRKQLFTNITFCITEGKPLMTYVNLDKNNNELPDDTFITDKTGFYISYYVSPKSSSEEEEDDSIYEQFESITHTNIFDAMELDAPVEQKTKTKTRKNTVIECELDDSDDDVDNVAEQLEEFDMED